jgi:hypothetical protein
VKLGWLSANMIGPFHWVNYLQPFFCFVVPNLFLTSASFFGQVAYARNNRVIYAGAIVFFFGYVLAQYVLRNLPNKTWVYLVDPFAFNAIRLTVSYFSPEEVKRSLVRIEGWMLVNRVLWGSVGVVVLLGTWLRFSFARFFSGKQHKQRLGARRRPGFAWMRVSLRFRPILPTDMGVGLSLRWRRPS